MSLLCEINKHIKIRFPLGSKQNEHKKSIKVSFICRDRYKLYATINIKDITDVYYTLPQGAYELSCTLTYANLFCLKANDTEWKRSLCRYENDIFECPLFAKFKSYFDFFKWKLSTTVVKIILIYDIYQTTFTTIPGSVSPLFTCENIRSIQENDEMFHQNKL